MPLTFRSKAKMLQIRRLATKLRLGQASPSSTSDSSSKTGTSGAGLSKAYQAWEQSQHLKSAKLKGAQSSNCTVYDLQNWGHKLKQAGAHDCHQLESQAFLESREADFQQPKQKETMWQETNNSQQNQQHPLSLALLLPPCWLQSSTFLP